MSADDEIAADCAVALFRERFSNCPACGAPLEVTIDTLQPNGKRTLDVLHPKPRCAGFEAFMKRVRVLARVSARNGHGTLV